MKYIFILLFSILPTLIFAQNQRTEVRSQARTSVAYPHSQANDWAIHLNTILKKEDDGFGQIKQVKQHNLKQRHSSSNHSSYKTQATQPVIGKSFEANRLPTLTPPDNGIAISNDGWIVSVNNHNLEVYDNTGAPAIQELTWNSFLNNDSNLALGKFDPRVLYDPYHDRFIMTILHGPGDTLESKIILAFSQSADPRDPWNIYTFNGNPFFNAAWTDYPSLGLNEHELFYNANLFEPAPNFNFKGSYIHQIKLENGYNGSPLQFQTWFNLNAEDGTPAITLNPASHGHGSLLGNDMYFVQMRPDSGSKVYMYHIYDTINAPNINIDSFQFDIPFYSACADAPIKDLASGATDTLSTGACWVHNAFELNDKLHFTFAGNMNGWCGIHHGIIDLQSNSASYTSYSQNGTDMAYPAIASISSDANDESVVLAFVRADERTLPEFDIIIKDNAQNWSAPKTIKTGDTIVDILPLPNYERWGDYTGICRKMNASPAEVWANGGYSGNTPPRLASWKTWTAQIYSSDNNPFLPTANSTTLYPNPSVDNYSLLFDLKESSQVQIRIIDISGRLIKRLFDGELPASKNELSFNRNNLPSGHYFIQVFIDGDESVKRLILQD